LIIDSDYTVTHNETGTKVTFLNPIWDDMPIVVVYETTTASGTGSSVNQNIVDRAISKYGESATLIVASQTTYSDYGDFSQTTSSSTITVVHNDIQGDEEFNKDGRYRPGDKVFFAKSDVSGLAVSNRIKFNGATYEIKDVITHHIQGKDMVHEVRCGRI